jgi:hypothetical protein
MPNEEEVRARVRERLRQAAPEVLEKLRDLAGNAKSTKSSTLGNRISTSALGRYWTKVGQPGPNRAYCTLSPRLTAVSLKTQIAGSSQNVTLAGDSQV